MKDDAIAHLSDQLMALSTRLQEIERRQQLAYVYASIYHQKWTEAYLLGAKKHEKLSHITVQHQKSKVIKIENKDNNFQHN